MSARLVAGFLTLLAFGLVGGGGAAHEGQKVVGYSGKTNNWVKAPDNGRYSLRGVSGQNVTYYVEKGEHIGFRKSRENDIVAIAGSNAPVQLTQSEARKAYWKFAQKDSK